jgi:hypothetical protein
MPFPNMMPFPGQQIGNLGRRLRQRFDERLPSLLMPGEQLLFAGKVDRETDSTVLLIITDRRLITANKEIFPFVQVPLNDVESYRIDFFDNVSIRTRSTNRNVKLGTIMRTRDVPIIKSLLAQFSNSGQSMGFMDSIISTVSDYSIYPGHVGSGIAGAVNQSQPGTIGGLVSNFLGNQGVPVEPQLPRIDPNAYGQIPPLERAAIEAKLPAILAPQERLLFVAGVLLFGVTQPGQLFITDQRFIAVTTEMHTVVDIPLEEIETFEAQPEELVSVQAGGDKLTIGFLNKSTDSSRLSRALSTAIADLKKALEPAAPPAEADSAAEGRVPQEEVRPAFQAETQLGQKLADLAALHQKGVLTDEEFASAKARALGI